MASYPIKMLKDEQGVPFVPLVSTEGIQDPNGETLEDKLAIKLGPANLLGGENITVRTEGTNCYIDLDLPASLNVINNLTTTSSGQGALDAYQGKVLKDSIPGLVDNLTSTSITSALTANQGKMLNEKFNDYLPLHGNADTATKATQDGDGNNIIDTYCTKTSHSSLASRVDALDNTFIGYNQSYGGLLVQFPDAKLYQMITVKVFGNGYGINPIDTIIQGYQYSSTGNFIQCKQHNNAGELGAATFFIYNGVINLWLPVPVAYSSFIVQAYRTIPTAEQLPITCTYMAGRPAGSNAVACTIV